MRYAHIDKYEITNGVSNGISVYIQGCHLRCPGCFNPETHDFNGGKEWAPETEKEFLELAKRPYIQRISILGGEPLAPENVKDVSELVNKIYFLLPDKKIWIYSGYTFEQIIHPVVTDDLNPERDEIIQERINILSKCDVLVDGRFEEDKKDLTLKFRGSSNQRLIDLREAFRKGEIVLWK